MADLSLPHLYRGADATLELVTLEPRRIAGRYSDTRYGHNRLSLIVHYADGNSEYTSFLADKESVVDAEQGLKANSRFDQRFEKAIADVEFLVSSDDCDKLSVELTPPLPGLERTFGKGDLALFDISDLVYYIGHHDNLTGIQRVQACVLLGLLNAEHQINVGYISFNNKLGRFELIEQKYFESLLVDLSRSVETRLVSFDRMDARSGILPQSQLLDAAIESFSFSNLAIVLLGAAWVNRDYFARVADLKRRYNALFCMTVHDLIPIFARETCDQGTAIVFEEFIRKSIYFCDHFFTVSEYTAYDLHRFARTVGFNRLPITAVKNAHTFDEFFKATGKSSKASMPKGEFVLFVSTIEGRKNHNYIFDVWQSLVAAGTPVPTLVCVGRLGWRAESFLEKMLSTDNLGGKIQILSEVSDSLLDQLYKDCLFTVYPSSYEGWGLPVGESLSKGKICLTSSASSLPEVGGEFAVYADLSSVQDGVERVRYLLDKGGRQQLERRVEAEFKPRTWKVVAEELVAALVSRPYNPKIHFPVLETGREYKNAWLPPRTFNALGHAMIAQVESARRSPLTRTFNSDDDLILSQAVRYGSSWQVPEDWGTWSRYPSTERLFYLRGSQAQGYLQIYESYRVCQPLVGQELEVYVNDTLAGSTIVDGTSFSLRLICEVKGNNEPLRQFRIRYRFVDPVPEIYNDLKAIDGRMLGLGFVSTLIVAERDLELRLALMERAVFGTAHQQVPTLGGAAGLWWADRRRSEHATSGDESAEAHQQSGFPRLAIGRAVSRGDLGTGRGIKLIGNGWHDPEDGGVWSNSEQSELKLGVMKLPSGGLFAILAVRAFAGFVGEVEFSVASGSNCLLTSTVSDATERKLVIPLALTDFNQDKTITLSLGVSTALSPAGLGLSGDKRQLGAFLTSAEIRSRCFLEPGFYLVTRDGIFSDAFSDGWYAPEDEGIWSGKTGRFQVQVKPQAGEQVLMTFTCRIFGTAVNGRGVVDVSSGDNALTTWEFLSDEIMRHNVEVEPEYIEGVAFVTLDFDRPRCLSPEEAGVGDDPRHLGLWISDVEMAYIAPSSSSSLV